MKALETEITELRLPPGTKLVADDICARFGVSRSPVREALQVLAAEGLADYRPRRGMVVAPFSLARLDEIYACRGPMEALSAAGVAENATPLLVKQLDKLVSDMAKALHRGRNSDAFAANVKLTDLLHANCGNETLKRMLQMLDKQALRYRYYCYQKDREIVTAGIEANRALVEAIRQNDAATASRITEKLIKESWKIIRAALLEDEAIASDAQGREEGPPQKARGRTGEANRKPRTAATPR